MPQFIPNGSLIKQIHDRLEKKANNSLRAQDLTLMQVSVLMELNKAENKQLAMKELERCFGIAQSTVVGIISRLEQKKLIEALSDPDDKRIKIVHITNAGENCCTDASRHMKEMEEILLNGFSEEDQYLLNLFLKRILRNLN